MEKTTGHLPIEKWIIQYLEGDIDGPTLRDLEQWVKASDSNQKFFDEYVQIWLQAGQVVEMPNLQLLERNSWQAIEKEVQLTQNTNKGLWLKIAAGILLLVVFGLAFNPYWKETSESFMVSSDDTPSGLVFLPDSSKVWLNKRSTLVYEASSENRIIQLEGEAFFEVRTDSSRLFQVWAGWSRTSVLGTSFNINANNSAVEIRVASGRVAFEDEEEKIQLILEKGQRAAFSKDQRTLIQLEDWTGAAAVWQTGMLRFDNTKLKDVAEVLFEVKGIRLTFEDQSIGECLLNLEWPIEQPDLLIEVLEFSMALEIEQVSANEWNLKGAGCE